MIGGSIGQAIIKKFRRTEVIGIPRRKVTIDQAKKRKAISRGTLDISAVHEADLIIIATPIDTIVPTLKAMIPHLKKGTIVTDVASTKSVVVSECEALCPPGVHFVGGHPMAGLEVAGIEHASAALLQGATFVITQTKYTSRTAVKQLALFVKKLGMKPLVLLPAIHDLIVAAVSHLPYLTAVTLASAVADMKDQAELIRLIASTGFRDTTRVASSAPSWGRDVVSTNREQLIEVLDRFQNKLDAVRALIDSSDVDALEKMFKNAKTFRDALYPRPRSK